MIVDLCMFASDGTGVENFAQAHVTRFCSEATQGVAEVPWRAEWPAVDLQPRLAFAQGWPDSLPIESWL